MINQRKTQYSCTAPCLIHNSQIIIFITKTADNGLTINSNMSMDGFEMVFRWGYWRHVGVEGLLSVSFWGYGLSSIKPNDDSSREARPSVCGYTARINIISFHNENEYGAFIRSSHQANIDNRMSL